MSRVSKHLTHEFTQRERERDGLVHRLIENKFSKQFSNDGWRFGINKTVRE